MCELLQGLSQRGKTKPSVDQGKGKISPEDRGAHRALDEWDPIPPGFLTFLRFHIPLRNY